MDCVLDSIEEDEKVASDEFNHAEENFVLSPEEYVEEEMEKPICRPRGQPLPCKIPKGIWQRIHKYDSIMFSIFKSRKKKFCLSDSSLEYLYKYIYPHLIPAFEKMCLLAWSKNFFNHPRQIFDCLDCIAEILYNTSPARPTNWLWKPIYLVYKDRPFLKRKPRIVYPLHYVLTEDEAAIIIQAHIRGYLCRKHLDLEYLRNERRKRELREKCEYLKRNSSKRFD